MNKYPLISFCIPTFKRPDLLTRTIESVLNQTYENIEIIVSDNDPLGSAEAVVKKFKSKKIHYSKNKKNIGMVKNFNKALVLAKGDYFTFLSDDDLLEKNMLSILMNLYNLYPDRAVYIGAYANYIIDQTVAQYIGSHSGTMSYQNFSLKEGHVTHINQDSFLRNFFSYKIFPYIQCTAGIFKKSLAMHLGGMPDYGAEFLGDYAFICLMGVQGESIVINKVLGKQTIHKRNFFHTMEDPIQYACGVIGFHQTVYPYVKKNKIENIYEHYIMNRAISDMTTGTRVYNRLYSDKKIYNLMISAYDLISESLPFFKKRKNEFILRSRYYMPLDYIYRIITFDSINMIKRVITNKLGL